MEPTFASEVQGAAGRLSPEKRGVVLEAKCLFTSGLFALFANFNQKKDGVETTEMGL